MTCVTVFNVVRLVAGSTAMALMSACSGATSPAADATPQSNEKPAAVASTSAPAQPAEPTACALVTEAEMSAILGSVVKGTSSEGGGSTTCSYAPTSGTFPAAELKVDWGSASAAMLASGMMGRIEPGISNPLAGLGDKAAQIGPVLWVQVGEDLFMITMMGVDDPVAAARTIITTARPRLPKTS